MQHRKAPFSVSKRLLSFRYAIQGLMLLIRYEHNAWIHLAITIAVVVLAIIVHLTSTEWIFIALSIGLVFVAELFNTAIEQLSNAITLENHQLIKNAKDISAAAVFVAAITAATIGMIVFIPKVIALLSF